MRTLTLEIGPEQDGKTVKRLLRRELCMADGLIARVKLREGGITLNGEHCRTVDTVREGDMLAVQVGDEPAETGTEPMAYSLEALYEDEDILIINKPAGMAVHGAVDGRGECTVANALAAYWGTDVAFHPVNRLDKGTSGLMAVAKSGYIHDRLRMALHTDAFVREYLAVAEGEVSPPRGSIELPIAREPGSTIKREVSPHGAYARTDYEALAFENGRTLLRLSLKTGRTHQIRVHLAAVGHPLTGDWLYGRAEPGLIGRPALHSELLELIQPVTGKKISARVPLPEDMAALMKRTLRKA